LNPKKKKILRTDRCSCDQREEKVGRGVQKAKRSTGVKEREERGIDTEFWLSTAKSQALVKVIEKKSSGKNSEGQGREGSKKEKAPEET